MRKATRAMETATAPRWIMNRYGQFLAEEHQRQMPQTQFAHLIEMGAMTADAEGVDRQSSNVNKNSRRTKSVVIRPQVMKGTSFQNIRNHAAAGNHRRSMSDVSRLRSVLY